MHEWVLEWRWNAGWRGVIARWHRLRVRRLEAWPVENLVGGDDNSLMSTPPVFAEVVDAADALSEDEQEDLIQILRKRRSERGRQRVLRDIAEARADFAAGKIKPATVDEIMRGIES